MTMVPYKGLAPAFTDLLAGNIQMVSATPVELKPFIDSGKIKMLGSSGPKRSALLPDVPAIAETIPGHAIETWNGLLVPAGTSQAVVDALGREMINAHKSPEYRERLLKVGVDPVSITPAEFAQLVAADTERWRKLVPESASTCSDETHLGRGNGALAVHPRWLLLLISFEIHLFSWDWIYAARNQQVEAVGQSPSHRPADGRDHYQSRPQAAPTKQRRILGLSRCAASQGIFSSLPCLQQRSLHPVGGRLI